MTLRAALAAEAEGRFLDSLALVHAALAAAPDDADACNLLGRLCAGGGDLTGAIGLQRLALRLAPAHPRAAADLALALAAVPDAAEGRRACDAALARAPELALHHRIPASLLPFEGMDAVRALLERALACDPALAAAHAALGNLHVRELRHADALAAYRRALVLEPDFAPAQLAAAELAHALESEAVAEGHRARALAHQQLYAEPAAGAARSVLVLNAPAPWSANVPLDLFVDRARNALQRLYLVDPLPAAAELPPYDLVFNAVGEAELAQPAIALAARFIAAQTKPALNLPHHLAKTARPALAAALRGVPGCTVPPTVRLARADVPAAELRFPLAVRPVDAHGGHGLARVDDRAALDAYLAASPAARFDLTEFVDYRDPDGYYRKYRIMFVGGEPFAYHLAIGSAWIVHHLTSEMRAHAWMRAEEAAFLEDPRAVFAGWDDTCAALAAAIGLDYFGIDCARTPAGGVLVFEADAATMVHTLDPDGLFPYRNRAVARIAAALDALFERTIRAGSAPAAS